MKSSFASLTLLFLFLFMPLNLVAQEISVLTSRQEAEDVFEIVEKDWVHAYSSEAASIIVAMALRDAGVVDSDELG